MQWTTRLGRRPDVALVALVALWAIPYAALGPGYVLDDWFTLGNARFRGALAAAGRDQWWARPGAGASYAAAFGLLGGAPLALYGVQTAVNAAVALLFRRLLVAAGTAPPLALTAAALWVVLPNHTSQAYWASAVNIALAAACGLGGLLVLRTGSRGWHLAAAGGLLAAATLSYEAVVPGAAAAAVVLAPARARRAAVAAAAAGLALASAWVVWHWHPAKRGIDQTADWRLALEAHLGWGVLPDPLAAGAAVLGVAAVAVVAVRAAHPRYRPSLDGAERLVLAGVATIVLGTLPFARYYYQPLGAGDRVNVVAGLGTALIWAGLLWTARRLAPAAAVGGLSALLVLGFAVEGWRAAAAWSRAGDDAAHAVDALRGEHPCPSELEVEATPFHRNVSGVLDASGATRMAWIACGTDDVTAVVVARRQAGAGAAMGGPAAGGAQLRR